MRVFPDPARADESFKSFPFSVGNLGITAEDALKNLKRLRVKDIHYKLSLY
jgi:hypothetical protein